MFKRTVVQKGHTSSVVMDIRKGRPVITLEGNDVVISQVAYPPEDKCYRIDKTIDKMYPMEVLLQMPGTKKEAIEKGESKYFSNKPCIHGHLTYRAVGTGACAQCSSINSKEYVKDRRTKGNVMPWEQFGRDIKQILSTIPATIRNSNETVITDRLEAAKKGLVFFYDPKPCLNGHRNKQRYTSTNACVLCNSERQQEYRERQKQKKLTVDNENLMANPTVVVEGQ